MSLFYQLQKLFSFFGGKSKWEGTIFCRVHTFPTNCKNYDTYLTVSFLIDYSCIHLMAKMSGFAPSYYSVRCEFP